MTLGGEFTGGESSWWRDDRKPFVRCGAVVFEVLKAFVYLAMAYLLLVRACFFAICKAKVLLQLF